MEDIVDPTHSGLEGGFIAHITNVELDLVGNLRHLCLILMTHVVLLLLIAREDADFANVGTEETIQYCVTEGACASSDHQDFVFENTHIVDFLIFEHKLHELHEYLL